MLLEKKLSEITGISEKLWQESHQYDKYGMDEVPTFT